MDGANEITPLGPLEEIKFKDWVKKSQIKDADNPKSFYDYRGLFRELNGAPVPLTKDRHFPDTYKQHGHPTFSVESKYSKGPNDGGRWEGETFIPPNKSDDSLRTSITKGLIRSGSAFIPEVHKAQFKQFFGEEQLPDSPNRPTSLTKFQDQPFKSERKFLPHLIKMPLDAVGRPIDPEHMPYKMKHSPTVAMGGDYGGIGSPYLTNYMGLGNATTSLGMDEQNKPYMSIFDSWDFNEDPLDKFFIKPTGTPFNVYDRIPITPAFDNTVPEYVDPFSKGDIDLPPDLDRINKKMNKGLK